MAKILKMPRQNEQQKGPRGRPPKTAEIFEIPKNRADEESAYNAKGKKWLTLAASVLKEDADLKQA
jgi:hypothetical protein